MRKCGIFIVLHVLCLLCISVYITRMHTKHHQNSLTETSRKIYKTNNEDRGENLANKTVCGNKITHVYFNKVSKSGSTTVSNILMRFGITHNLNMLTLFKGAFSYPKRNFEARLPEKSPKRLGVGGKYDIYCEHSVFDKEYLQTKLHEDTINIGIVREPLSRLRSAFNFFHIDKEMKLPPGKDPIVAFLQNPDHYYSMSKRRLKSLYGSYFGFVDGKDDIQEYLTYIEKNFLVLIMEKFSQSLILLKRKLCWDIKDIIFAHAKKRSYKKPSVNQSLVEQYKTWNPVDFMFYDHFNQIHHNMVDKQLNNFNEEVAMFEIIQKKINQFCVGICKEMGKHVRQKASDEMLKETLESEISFAESEWDAAFNFDGFDCLMTRFHPQMFRDANKIFLYPELCKGKLRLVHNRNYCAHIFKYNIPFYALRKAKFDSECY